jgi:hypothetical protein
MKKKLIFGLLALFCAATLATAQDLPRIAVYVTGDVPENERTALGTVMLSSLINSGRYRGIERSGAFLAEIEREQVTQRSGTIDDNQISKLGRQFGVRFVCIAAITPAFGSYQISARIVDVETAEVIFIGQAFSRLRSAQDLTRVSDEVVNIMFRGQAAPRPDPAPPTVAQSPATPPTPRTTENVMEDGRRRVNAAQPAPAKPPKPASFWAAIGLDVLGVGLIAYGIIENGNVTAGYNSENEYNRAKNAVTNRNIAYTIGVAALLGGITIHIFF